jgi:hypothetical protein
MTVANSTSIFKVKSTQIVLLYQPLYAQQNLFTHFNHTHRLKVSSLNIHAIPTHSGNAHTDVPSWQGKQQPGATRRTHHPTLQMNRAPHCSDTCRLQAATHHHHHHTTTIRDACDPTSGHTDTHTVRHGGYRSERASKQASKRAGVRRESQCVMGWDAMHSRHAGGRGRRGAESVAEPRRCCQRDKWPRILWLGRI